LALFARVGFRQTRAKTILLAGDGSVLTREPCPVADKCDQIRGGRGSLSV